MAFTKDTKLKEFIDNPEARKILEENFPMDLEGNMVKLAYGMTIEQALSFPQVGLDEAQRVELIEQLCAAAEA
ncbi:MAG: hypothetical protein IJO87_08780 [Eggerthellaceae bacterium]|nr:hypothetical protein [Eggerthellaceae bacterium]